MILNIGDKKTKLLLSLAKTPLPFYPYYKYHLPLPSVLMIENTNHCNAECVMCPRDTLSRKRGFMDFGLFEKIMKEVSSVRGKPVTHLHGFGEPLLDKLLAERIQFAKTCGIKRTYIVTNASLLFPEISRKIISAGLDKMKISIYGTDEESYNNTMKRLNFKVTLQNIKDFLRIRKEMKRENPRLILQYLPNETNNAKTAEFRSLWSPLIDPHVGDCLNVSSLHNYGGGRAYNRLGKEIVSVCYFPWTSMSVLWDGSVVTCCMDSNGVQVLGDLNSQSVQEVWNGPVLSGVRNNFRKLDYSKYPVCLSCDWVRRR
ncbi:MAG TPA: SPASM domain-containing protein [Patescibacteria group bacterium]|nr:SPASM domain-containing protein [Patescibacteria group bacterium]